jgi:hypothetical protein
MYPNLDFWFENKPSGNPGREPKKKEKIDADFAKQQQCRASCAGHFKHRNLKPKSRRKKRL